MFQTLQEYADKPAVKYLGLTVAIILIVVGIKWGLERTGEALED